ncbi:MAG: putative Zn-dependent protease [Gammaproteobacteria bacterium]|jgi:predicted Zn-dependent protease
MNRKYSLSSFIARPIYLIGLLLAVVYSQDSSAATELPMLGENAALNIEQEKKLGYSVYKKLLERDLIETDALLDRYINDLGDRLLAGIENRVRKYRFFIVKDGSVNAFALPGGYIGVNYGLIAQTRNQHQLASVLAHEIAHVELMHGLDLMEKGQKMNNATLLAVLAGLLLGGVDSQVGAAVVYGGVAGSQQSMVNFTRENEYEADRVGIELMQNARFDPTGMVEFFEIIGRLSGNTELSNIEYMRTHPISENRVAEAASRAKDLVVDIKLDSEFVIFKDYLTYIASNHMEVSGSEFLQALALLKFGAYSDAEVRLRGLYRSNSDSIWFGVAYAENLELLQQPDEAEKIYRHLLDIFPGDYVLSMRLLRLMKVGGRYQLALVTARELENRFPEERQVYFELSEIYKGLQKSAMRLMAEAEFHRLTGNVKQAIRLYDEILAGNDVDLATESKAKEKRFQLLDIKKQ